MSTVTKSKILRNDYEHWDGINKTKSRVDSTGGTITGVKFGDTVDVLMVYGSGTEYTSSTINSAVSRIPSSVNCSFQFATGTWTITEDVTIPSNITCIIPNGCDFSISAGITLTINGYAHSDKETFHSGSGTYTPGKKRRNPVFYEKTATETASGVTPINYEYDPGHLLRYGTNTTPGTTDMTTAFNNAVSTGHPVMLPEGTILISSEITHTSNRILITGAGKEKTTIIVDGSYTGFIIRPQSSYILKDFTIIGSNIDGCYGVGSDQNNSGGMCVLERIDIRNCDISVNFDDSWEHSVGLRYEDIYIQTFRTCGINLGGDGGAASSGEGKWNFEDIVVTNANSDGIDISSSVATDTPDSTHDRVTWTNSSSKFGDIVQRSADGSTDWHVPPNWSSADFTSGSFDAEKTAMETWNYRVVRNTVAINIARAISIAMNNCAGEYTSIGLKANNITALSVDGWYSEIRTPDSSSIPNFAAIHLTTTFADISSVWAEENGYAVFVSSNSKVNLRNFRCSNLDWAAIGNTGSTSQVVNYSNIQIAGTTPAIYKSPTGSANDYNYSAAEWSSTDFTQKIGHVTKPQYSLDYRGINKSNWYYDATNGAQLDLNRVTAENFGANQYPIVKNNNSTTISLSSGVATDIFTMTVDTNGSGGSIFSFNIYVYDGSIVHQQSCTGTLYLSWVSAAGTTTATATLGSFAKELASGTLSDPTFTAGISSQTITVKVNTTTSISSPSLLLTLMQISEHGVALTTGVATA